MSRPWWISAFIRAGPVAGFIARRARSNTGDGRFPCSIFPVSGQLICSGTGHLSSSRQCSRRQSTGARSSWPGDNDPERADELVAATLERQSVLQRADPPEVIAVLHEMVLHRLIGSAEIMHDQLIHLVDWSERPNISVHVVPSGVGAHAGLSGDINLASGDGDPDVLHTDAVPEGHTSETRSLVRRATVTFERVRRDALPCVQSRDLILEVANERWMK